MIIDLVKDAIKKHQLVNKGDRVLIGISGGPDSLALLYLLYQLRDELSFTLYLAHLDHKLRAGSSYDSKFVKLVARKLDLPIVIKAINVLRLAKKGSVEEIARNARFDFLFKAAKKYKCSKIALGHNLDDQAETVLMRIIRGAGLNGLAGILPKRKISGYWIIRPLVEISRKEIENFLREIKVKPRLDPSNASDVYFRNKIRNNLLPLLEARYNKNIKLLLSNMAESVGYDYDYLNNASLTWLAKAGSAKGVSVSKLLKLHPALRRIILRLCIQELKGDMRRLTFGHIKEIEELLLSRPSGSIVDLPKGVSVVKNKGFIRFYLR